MKTAVSNQQTTQIAQISDQIYCPSWAVYLSESCIYFQQPGPKSRLWKSFHTYTWRLGSNTGNVIPGYNDLDQRKIALQLLIIN